RAVLEAMSSGCCVVVSDISDFHRFIEHGKNGFLFPAGDIGTLRNILQSILNNPAVIQEISLEASKTMKQRFTDKHETLALLELYQQDAMMA
ncbi:MAG TPA: glycosyltransferase, partial [Chromatiaceae bacterium]|nr:glycosyltransferase [Chromatiaceae bacterium]